MWLTPKLNPPTFGGVLDDVGESEETEEGDKGGALSRLPWNQTAFMAGLGWAYGVCGPWQACCLDQ